MRGSALYLLDTNMVGYIVAGRSKRARTKMEDLGETSRVAISSITEGEIRFGLARKPQAVRLAASIELFLSGLEILPWDSEGARRYGVMRAKMASEGKSLSSLDMLIAAQAVASEAVLVTADRAFGHVQGLRSVNWATDL